MTSTVDTKANTKSSSIENEAAETKRETLTLEQWKKFTEKWVPYDPRFPNTNQTRNCQQNYIDYHRCLRKKDEDYCAWYKNAYKQLCPPDWIERYDEQIENGTFPVKLD